MENFREINFHLYAIFSHRWPSHTAFTVHYIRFALARFHSVRYQALKANDDDLASAALNRIMNSSATVVVAMYRV